MSKKPAALSPPPSAAAGDAGVPKLLCPARVNLDDAMARLSPFIFTVDTDTKETVETKPLIANAIRDPTIAASLTQVDKVDAAQFVAGLNDPGLATLIADVKAQLPAILEGGGDSNLLAQCVRCKIVALAVEREEARLDEEEAAAARHAELVERLMEEGLTRSEAEKAAAEEEAGEEAAANGAGDGDDDEEGGVARPQSFVMLRGFPNTTADIIALASLRVPLDALFNVNSLARLGRRDEPAAVDPKAKGKKPEAKKPEVKKPGAKGGKGAAVDEAPVPVESLGQQLARERAKLPRFDSTNPLRHTAIWTYNVQTAESRTGAVDEAGVKLHDLLESEAEVSEKLANEIVRLEQSVFEYREWLKTRVATKVQMLNAAAGADRGGSDDDLDPEAAAKQAADAAAAAEAAAKAAAEAAAKEKAAAGAKKGPAAKGGAAAKPADEPVVTEDAGPPPPPPLPQSARDLPVDDELYRRLVDEVAPANMSAEVRMHCILEQVQDSVIAQRAASSSSNNNNTNAGNGNAAAATTSAASVAETIAIKTRRDVADFCDYVLAQLDGTQDAVFEAARKRRLKAAEASAEDASGEAAGDAQRVPLAEAEYIRLLPAVQSTVDPDALLLGVPLRRIEARVRRALEAGALSDAALGVTVAKTDIPTLDTVDNAAKLFRHLLVDRAGMSESEAALTLKARTRAQLLTPDALRERLTDVLRTEPSCAVYKATCLDGSHVIAMLHSVPTERRRFASTWRVFHGHIPFPTWLEWADFVKAEDLFFNPPPRDDDDYDEPADDEQEDEEEEEEEEEVGVDDDGEPIMRKKPRKQIIYPPEYTTNDVAQLEQLRRRATLDQFRERLNRAQPEQLLLADNHTSHTLHSESSTLYPSDGSTVGVDVITANQRTVHCTVRAESGVSFGFRALVAAAAEDEGATAGAPDGNRADQATAAEAQTTKSPKISPRGPPPAKPDTSAAGASAADGSATTSAAPAAPPVVVRQTSNVSIIMNLQDDAIIHVGATCSAIDSPAAADSSAPRAGNATPPPADIEQPTTATEAPPRIELTAAEGPEVTLRCVLSAGLTVEVLPRGAIRIVPETPRESPVTVYNPLTRQIARIAANEVSRVVTLDGSVLCSFDDGTKMNLFPNGNTAVFHEGCWLITNAAGRRVLKDANGKVTPLVMSLVTSNTDTETLSKLTTREDGVVTVNYDDGKSLAQHIDGTRMWRDPGRTVVEVEADGLPRVTAALGAGPASAEDDSIPVPLRAKLCVKTLGDLSLTLVPREFVLVTHPASGFQSVVDLRSLLVHCDVGASATPTRYVLDAAYGGLRAVDKLHSLHVTPFGRAAYRTVAEDQPVAPTTEPFVKQVIDIFMRPEVLNPAFARAMTRCGRPVGDALHMLPNAPPFDASRSAAAALAGLQPPPRSRQLRDKEQGCLAQLRKSLAPATATEEAPPSYRPPLLFVSGPRGCMELMRRSDLATLARVAAHRSNLLFTDVHTEPVSVMDNAEAGLRADGTVEVPVAPPALPQEAAGGGDPSAAANSSNAVSAAAGDSIIVSIAPPRPVVRTGIPKILLDLRRASARSGPVSVAAFIHELKQGPQQAKGAAAGGGQGEDGLGATGIAASTRHFVSIDPAVWAPHKAGAGGAAATLPIVTPAPGAPCYDRALLHLARAIPPVIAAQLLLSPGQRLASTTQQRGRRTNTGGSRSSRGATRSLPPKKSGTGGGSRPPEDPEFETQMAEIEAREKANRKPWPTPIADRKTAIEAIQRETLGNFWASTLGAAEVPRLAKENEAYKAVNGYRKVPVPQYNEAAKETLASRSQRSNSTSQPGDTAATAALPPPQPPQQQQPQPVANPSGKGSATVPSPPRQAKPAADTVGRGRSTTQQHATTVISPAAALLSTSLPAPPTAEPRIKMPPMLAATPHSLHLGSIVANHRYAADVKLTNVGSASCRFRLVVEPAEAAAHIKVHVPQLSLAAGICTVATVEIDGLQREGNFNATITAMCASGATQIPLHGVTVADSGRGSAGHPRPGVRILGPSANPAAGTGWAPGTIKRAKATAKLAPAPDDSDPDM